MSPETARFNGLRALVVEDETIIALLVEDMLKELGFNEVVKASSVPQAIAALETAPPDIVILDVNLAGVQAYPVAERLQSAGIPFIFASGYGSSGIAAPWSGHPVLQKPFQADNLTEAIDACLRTAGRAPAE